MRQFASMKPTLPAQLVSTYERKRKETDRASMMKLYLRT